MTVSVLDRINQDRVYAVLKDGRTYGVKLSKQTTQSVETFAMQHFAKPTQVVRVLVEEGLRSFAAAQD